MQTRGEQVAEFLLDELRGGRWRDLMPGVLRLEKELGINRNTLEAALRLLERQGILVAQGAGRRRRIELAGGGGRRALRVGILTADRYDWGRGYLIELRHALEEEGHVAFFASMPMGELGVDKGRISALVKEMEADAWVVVSGSQEVLEWFEGSGLAAFALFGRRSGLRLASAGPNKIPATLKTVRRLVELGHRRIVLLNRRIRRIPSPGRVESAFLRELGRLGLPGEPYCMPDWEDSPAGFHRCLESLFQHTPPTALIADEAPYFLAAMQFCGNRGLHVPRRVSLVCTDADESFALFLPQVAHIQWDPAPLVRRVVRWTQRVAAGEGGARQELTTARFVEGGTIGRAPQR